MRLKIRTDKGDFTLPQNMVTEQSSLETLLIIIESQSQIPSRTIKTVLIGYPPRQVRPSIRNLSCNLTTLNIQNGDILTIKTGSGTASDSSERTSPILIDEKDKHDLDSINTINHGKIDGADRLVNFSEEAQVEAFKPPASNSKPILVDSNSFKRRKRASRELERTPELRTNVKLNDPNTTADADAAADLNFTAKKFSVPADNTCAFYSLYFLLNNGHLNKALASQYRQLVANKVLTNNTGLDNFQGEVTLGKPIEDYCAWIQSDSSWGGAIELSILAKHFKVCVAAIDVKSSRIDKYCTEFDKKTIFLMYDGIHYDPLYIEYDSIQLKVLEFDFTTSTNTRIIGSKNLQSSSSSSNQTSSENSTCSLNSNSIFNNKVISEFEKLADVLRAAREYCDGDEAVLCGQCNQMFRDINEAIVHSKKTGHINLQQIGG